MTTFLTNVITLFLVLPLLGFFLLFFITKLVSKNQRKSVHIALDYSTILFIISVYFLIKIIWERSFLGVIFLIMIVFAIILVFAHWKIKGEIDYRKLFKGFWRINFLFFCISYICLMLYGLIYRAVTFTIAG
ncbi:DUF3397 domain-containing protein [Bacillus rubiinfantis]|uniref:DUF3397 domain-containing protein n=1 Tax=Bacillus rubiinfantis TaxID=1499680 RepID=UPI0005A94B27|nr:DUF3397 domain-containing protein [Bacillus rubiinfantis]